jgi:hypothetical protein
VTAEVLAAVYRRAAELAAARTAWGRHDLATCLAVACGERGVDVRLAAPASVAPLVAFMRSSGDGPRTQPFTVGFFRAAADWYAPQRPEPDPQKPAKP